jgi:hypothetical protein
MPLTGSREPRFAFGGTTLIFSMGPDVAVKLAMNACVQASNTASAFPAFPTSGVAPSVAAASRVEHLRLVIICLSLSAMADMSAAFAI